MKYPFRMSTDPRHGLVDRILRLRGLRPSDLADDLGWPRSRVSNWANGGKHPSVPSLIEIGEHLGLVLRIELVDPASMRTETLSDDEYRLVMAYRNLRETDADLASTELELFEQRGRKWGERRAARSVPTG